VIEISDDEDSIQIGELDMRDIPTGGDPVTPMNAGAPSKNKRIDLKRKRHNEIMEDLQDVKHRMIVLERDVIGIKQDLVDIKRFLQMFVTMEPQE